MLIKFLYCNKSLLLFSKEDNIVNNTNLLIFK
nr:MAG TPA: hypothetical protein [Caudoviricetes sp.]DAW04151.1 MAG TPA: hypothetical protein [Caudoviricetes sp.]